MSEPVFAVVGHPNKGKSSIVATLAQDDSVHISPRPGTTTENRRYPMRVEDRVPYTLVDTPGFQRARRALAWMKEHATSAADRTAAVRAFVAEHQSQGKFHDECQLLTPILDGAGILYVVDGSVPYSSEYEAEMEILRWTGQPRMALINPIGSEAHVDDWRAALGQYFSVVRVFNAMTAEFVKRTELLRAFGQLRDDWRGPLDEAVRMLEADRKRRDHQAAREIARMTVDMMKLTVDTQIGQGVDPAPHRERLKEKHRDQLRQRERKGRESVEQCYDHRKIERQEQDVAILDEDLFSERSFLLFGVSRKYLIMAGVASGALAGGIIDAHLLGASFLTGTAIGSVVGGAAAWWSADRIADVKVGPLPLGGKRLTVGPSSSINLAYVVLGRALHHHALVASRTHAQRGALIVDDAPDATSGGRPWIDTLHGEQRQAIHAAVTLLIKSTDTVKAVNQLTEAIESVTASSGTTLS
jgi:hypothetical protein